MVTSLQKKLEELIRLAAENAGMRPAFYRALLKTEVYTLGEVTEELKRGSKKLALKPWAREDGTPIFPIFSSEEKMASVIDAGEPSIKVVARRLFEAHPEGWFVLNPHTETGKEFTPEEVQGLLDGSLFASEELKIEKNTQVLIGQPSEYPYELIKALNLLFGTLPGVHAAYIAEIDNPADEYPPHLIVGIENSGSFDKVAKETGMVARDFLGEDELLDVIQVKPNQGGIHAYLRRTMPIYLWKD